MNTRLILILVPAKQNDVKLYIFKSDTKISEQKKNLVSHHKSKPVSLQVMYTRHSTLHMYISCAAVHVCPSEKRPQQRLLTEYCKNLHKRNYGLRTSRLKFVQ